MADSGHDEQNNTVLPYEMTMEVFLNRLEQVRKILWMDQGCYMPDGELKAIKDTQMLFRFISLNEVAEVWVENQPNEIDKRVFEKLNEFLAGIELSTNESLYKNWKKTMGRQLDWEDYPKKPVKECIKVVCDNRDKAELAKRYGIEKFSDASYVFKAKKKGDEDKTLEDYSILSILGLILLWFSALPYKKGAKKERAAYCSALEGLLKILLDPTRLEFMLGVQAAQDNPALITMLEEDRGELFQQNKDLGNTRSYIPIEMEKEYSK